MKIVHSPSSYPTSRQGARGLPPKLTKRIVYRTDYLLSNGYGFPEELSRYDLTRVTPYTSDMCRARFASRLRSPLCR